MKLSSLRLPVFRAALLGAQAVLLFVAVDFFTDTFDVNRVWMHHVEIPSAAAFDENTFEFLVDGGAIWPVRDGMSVTVGHTPCNTLALRSPESVHLVSGPAGRDGRKYVRELCESAQGERIRNEVANFNKSYRLAAVSDNRNADAALKSAEGLPCADGVGRATLFVPPRCVPNRWQATVAEDGRAVQSIAATAVSKRDYAFLATETETFFGDWRVISPIVDPQTGKAETYKFETSLAFGERAISIRTIGAVQSVSINGKTHDPQSASDPDSVRENAGKRLDLALETYCSDDTRSIGSRVACDGQDAQGRPTGGVIFLSGPKGQSATIELIVEPSIQIARELRRYLDAQRRGADTEDGETVALGFGRIKVACLLSKFEGGSTARGSDAGCTLDWTVPDNQRMERDTEPVTDLRIGELAALDARGVLTETAFKMGLQGLLGLGTSDTGSVAAALTRTADGENPTLTLEPDYQAKAMAALEANYRCSDTETDDCGRRADLIILDAEGANAGNVLAAASLPQPPLGLSAWDIETLELTSPSRSPLASFGWRNYDLRSTPGSAFKLVTAIAASQYLLDTGDQALKEILLGTNSISDMAALLGVHAASPAFNGRCRPDYDVKDPKRLNALPIPGARGGIVFCIGNSRNNAGNRVGLGHMRETGVESGCGDVRAPRAGLCEAVKRSSNLYFAGLAMYLDAHKFVDPETGNEHREEIDDLLFEATANKLFPGERSRELVDQKTALDVLDVNYPATGRGRSSPLVIEARLEVPPGEPRRLRLARGGIGLSVSASPLAMATIAGSIATGKIVRPHLVPRSQRGPTDDPVEGTPVLTAPPGKEDLSEALLEHVRDGMAAVVRKSGGTSRAAFAQVPAELRNSVFAKTGTAPVFNWVDAPEEGPYTAWLVGYVDPQEGLPGIDRRFSFACRVAYTFAYGGSVCGPIVRDFLLSLYESEQ